MIKRRIQTPGGRYRDQTTNYAHKHDHLSSQSETMKKRSYKVLFLGATVILRCSSIVEVSVHLYCSSYCSSEAKFFNVFQMDSKGCLLVQLGLEQS